MSQKLKRILAILLSYIPTRLPVGMTEFEKWSNSIVELCGPLADADSLKFAMASQIMHLPAGKDRVAKRQMVAALRKTASNQIAGQVFQDIKTRQAERQAAEQLKAQEAAAANGEGQEPKN